MAVSYTHLDVYKRQDLTFQGLPAAGVRITNLETTLKDSQLDWTVTGEIYAN